MRKTLNTNSMLFDLKEGDRFMSSGTEYEVVSAYNYEGIPYGFHRLLMKNFKDNVVYVVPTKDRSAIIPLRKNKRVFAY